ncbi:MAG: MFS transporter, partial [Firmicutes bacterium]|nr:MFS transporter [Bacillota bacterium]
MLFTERRNPLQKQTALRFAVLCAVPFVMVLGNSMLIPVFPQMKAVMHLTQFQVGLIVTFFSVPAGILIPLAGFLSDRYGRKAIMVPALFLY